jgi:DNA-binding transcriptional ArsR family regulator
MTVKQIPDYDLEEMIVVTAPGQLRALADPLRGILLDLLLERAATVTEMALAVDRPKSTVAYHVNLLVDAGLLRVVRTRRVRAIEERYYGRVARTIYIGALHRDEDKQIVSSINGLAQAAAEAAPAHAIDDLRCTLVHARIPREEVRNFWAAVLELSRQFAQIPRAGDQVYGFAAGLYPTDAPTLPDQTDGPVDLRLCDLGGGPQFGGGAQLRLLGLQDGAEPVGQAVRVERRADRLQRRLLVQGDREEQVGQAAGEPLARGVPGAERGQRRAEVAVPVPGQQGLLAGDPDPLGLRAGQPLRCLLVQRRGPRRFLRRRVRSRGLAGGPQRPPGHRVGVGQRGEVGRGGQIADGQRLD